MKHPRKVTAMLIALFVISQLVGLILINLSIESIDVNAETGELELNHTSTAIGERPDLEGVQSFLYLLVGIGIGTVLLLVLIHFKRFHIWKLWFFLAVFLAQSVALGVVMSHTVALIVAFGLALYKIYKPNPWVHNITEIFMYSGIAVLLVPILDVYWSIVLLLAISLYDAWAVWKSKHMVTMAKFQAESVFAGLAVPRPTEKLSELHLSGDKKSTEKDLKKIKEHITPPATPKAKMAILGGGDVAFPMLFTGAVMEGMLLSGVTRSVALAQSLIITLFVTIAVTLLFVYAKKDKFYPAMPFITAGCLAGWGVVLLVGLFL